MCGEGCLDRRDGLGVAGPLTLSPQQRATPTTPAPRAPPNSQRVQGVPGTLGRGSPGEKARREGGALSEGAALTQGGRDLSETPSGQGDPQLGMFLGRNGVQRACLRRQRNSLQSQASPPPNRQVPSQRSIPPAPDPPPRPSPRPASGKRVRGGQRGLGRYLVLSPKGNIADVGGEVRTARAPDPRPGEAAPAARAPSAPAARRPRATPPPGGERPALRRPPAGGGERSAQPGPAPPPSPPAPLGPRPEARPEAAPSAQEPRGRPGSAASETRPPGTRPPSPSPGSSPGSSQLSARLSHARPGGQRRPAPRASPLAPDQDEGPRDCSTPRRLPRGPVHGCGTSARGRAWRREPEGTRRGTHWGGSCAPPAAAPPPAPAPRPAGPARGRGRSAAAGRAGTELPEPREGARLRGAHGTAPGKGLRLRRPGPPERVCIRTLRASWTEPPIRCSARARLPAEVSAPNEPGTSLP